MATEEKELKDAKAPAPRGQAAAQNTVPHAGQPPKATAPGEQPPGTEAEKTSKAEAASLEQKEKPAGLEAQPEQAEGLAEELEQSRQAVQENYDRFLRLQAEFENYKKRLAKEKAESLKFANVPLLKDVLAIQDNLERATQHARKDSGGGVDAILSGVEMVVKQLNDFFGNHGLIRIEALGKTFDPTLHQAMGVVETAEAPENQVMEEFQAGYLLHDRVVRPAMVMVSKRAQGSPEAPAAEETQENKQNTEG